MTDLPVPLTPEGCDLRDFPAMMVDITRLFASEFHVTTRDDTAWRAGVTLWLKSFHQVPAASMPDDDEQLAHHAELGRDVKTWRKIKTKALRGWVKCSDGRLYHPVVAEKALAAYIDKLQQRKSSGAGNYKKYGTQFDPAILEQAIIEAAALLVALDPKAKIKVRRSPSLVPPGGDSAPPDPSSAVPPGVPPGRKNDPDVVPSGSQGKVSEVKNPEEKVGITSPRARDEANFSKVCALLSHNPNDPKNWLEFVDLQTRQGLDFERHIWPAAEHHKRGGKPGGSLAYIRRKAIEIKDQEGIAKTAPVIFEDADDDGWRGRMRAFKAKGVWSEKWGPTPGAPPGAAECRVPKLILAEFSDVSKGAKV